jgi:hypothetical protein
MKTRTIFPDYQKESKIIPKYASLDKYAQICLMIIWINKKNIRRAVKQIDPKAKITYRYTFNKLMNIKRVHLKDCWFSTKLYTISRFMPIILHLQRKKIIDLWPF